MPLERWLPDDLPQAIARENQLSETAFLVALDDDKAGDFHIRRFTPTVEVPCVATRPGLSPVIFNKLRWTGERIRLQSRSGPLAVERRADGWLELDFPNLATEPCPTPALIREALGDAPEQAFFVPSDTNYMVVMASESEVRQARPDLRKLAALGNQGLIITAPGNDCDSVSRYFAPGSGIDEDPVTGSIHSVMVPYWASILGSDRLEARQLSERGGELRCELRGDRVAIAGQAAFFMEGSVQLP